MLALLAVISGVLISVTVVQNGDLAAWYGNHQATVLVHLVGLATILLWMAVRGEKLRWNRGTPWYGYMGGVLGVLTVLGCNLSFASLGVSVSVAVMLLGQVVTGLLVDHFGLFGADRRPFQPRHLISLALIAGGVAVMIWL
ncbi:MAG: DMT family transporter [Clostridiales bacterium]|nr:DMT family transporter [Clostridiales bacterium]